MHQLRTKASGNTWHRRFGHINSSDLTKMKNGVVDGLECQGEINSAKNNCVVCCEGKQSRLPFQNVGTRGKTLLEVINTDLCGPMERKSIGGSRYFLTFQDDFSRMTYVYFLKSKNEVFKYFKEFESLVENQKNNKIKILRLLIAVKSLRSI